MQADPTSGERTDTSARSPHLNLLFQVFNRTVTDLFLVESSGGPDEEYRARKDAVAFFTSEGDAWAESREIICGALDMDPGVVRRKVIDLLEGRADIVMPLTWRKASIEPSREIWRQIRADKARDAAVAAYAKTKRLVARRKPPTPPPTPGPVPRHGTLPDGWWRAMPDLDEYSEIEVEL